jgi:hypothetical protein
MKRTISVLIILVMVLFSFSAVAFADGLPGGDDPLDNSHFFNNWKGELTQAQLMAMRGRSLQERIKVHGMNLKFDVPPVIKEGRTLVPVRAITNGMGAEVDWDADEKLITITRDDITIEFKLGDMFLTVWDDGDKEIIEMDYPASLISNRTFVPLRFIAEALGDKVGYDKDTGDIDVLPRLETPDRPWWDRFDAEWNEVDNAEVYQVRLFHEGDWVDTVTTSALTFDFETYMDEEDEEGCYVVKVTALATDEYSKSRESKPSYPKIVGECDNITTIEGQITELDEDTGMVEISFLVDNVITKEKVYVTDDTQLVVEGFAGNFEDLELEDEVAATLHDDDLIKLEVDND